MGFNYSKKINVMCILTFIMALLNLVIQFIWLTNFFNTTVEQFQAPGFNYGDVAFYNSIMMILICVIVVLGANDFSKYLYIAKYFIILFQFMQVILEFCICYNGVYQSITLLFIIQPVPFLVVLVLHMIKKISLKMSVLFCIFDYILFIGKECILNINDSLGFYIVFQGEEASVIKLFSCIMFVLVLLASDFLSPNVSLVKLIKKLIKKMKRKVE